MWQGSQENMESEKGISRSRDYVKSHLDADVDENRDLTTYLVTLITTSQRVVEVIAGLECSGKLGGEEVEKAHKDTFRKLDRVEKQRDRG